MINTDLRINNYVLANGKTDQISEVKTFEVSVYGCEDNVVLVEPIPLTEEWLARFGFEKKTDEGIRYFKKSNRQSFRVVPSEYDSETLIPTAENEYFVTYECDISCGFDFLRYIDHVHQLQNLYFALTGKELIIEKLLT